MGCRPKKKAEPAGAEGTKDPSKVAKDERGKKTSSKKPASKASKAKK